jgi:hypothetical protein
MGDPDSDGSPASNSAEIPAEESSSQDDERQSPPSDHPENDDVVPTSPASPIASSPNDSEEDETGSVIPEMDQDKLRTESGSKAKEPGRKRAHSSATESSPLKAGSSKSHDLSEGQERSQPLRKSRRVENMPSAAQTRSVGAGKGGLKKK